MEIVETQAQAKAIIRSWKGQKFSIGLVPTMGYLHEGHASLIRLARADNERVAVSVFVNPTQFAPGEDLASYPRDFERDRELCQSLGVDLIFHPQPVEMYPPGYATYVEAPSLSVNLCGRSRPTHFRGVLTVVLKLFALLGPDRAYFGLKDAQQFFIIKRMVEDLGLDLAMIPGPTVREPDGLALSSRNVYLSPAERSAALVLQRALRAAERLLRAGERRSDLILAEMRRIVVAETLARLDYAEIVETRGLSLIPQVTGQALVAIAVFFGKTRLIDNFLWEAEA
ncbi:MAG: pantoate--beta-alanine ligase [Deltaproteobacteria bacterium]|nr:pantoate--beta-alanine ligase [Deltaproteobacteria bacterium]